MDEQTTGLNAETAANAEAGTPEAGDGFGDLFLQAFTEQPDGAGEALAMGDAGNEPDGNGDGEPQEVPATDDMGGAENSPPTDGAESANPAPDKPNEAPKRILRYRDNHEEQEFNVSEATDAELIAMRQKANQYDRLKAAQAEYADAEKFRAAVQSKMKAFLDDYGVEGAKSLAVAGAMADGHKVYPISVSEDGTVALTKNYLALPETESAESVEAANAQPAPQTPEKPTLDAELKKLRAAFPNLTEIPNEAHNLVKSGLSLSEAVLITQMRGQNSELARLRKENQTLRQNAETARRAPVRGVSGGGNPSKPGREETDPFLREFLKP